MVWIGAQFQVASQGQGDTLWPCAQRKRFTEGLLNSRARPFHTLFMGRTATSLRHRTWATIVGVLAHRGENKEETTWTQTKVLPPKPKGDSFERIAFWASMLLWGWLGVGLGWAYAAQDSDDEGLDFGKAKSMPMPQCPGRSWRGWGGGAGARPGSCDRRCLCLWAFGGLGRPTETWRS